MAFYQRCDGERMRVGGGRTDGTLEYVGYPYATFADVYAAAVSNTPTGYGGASRLSINPQLLGGQVWAVDVEYGSPTDSKPALDSNTPTTLPAEPPAADPADIPPIAATQPVPLVPLEGQLGGPPGAGSFDPPGGGDGGDGTGGGLPSPVSREVPLGAEWSVDTTGGTLHVVQSIFTPYGRAAGFAAQAPDVKGAIGSTEDGVAGVDIVAPKLRITCTRTVRAITGGYLDAVSAITGSVNNAPFLFWAEGEVLFVGMSGPYQSPGGWKLSYEFWVSKNRENVEVIPPNDADGGTAAERGGLVLPAVGGWEYLDVGYAATEVTGDGGKKSVRRLPTVAYVHQVYYKKDFTALGFQ